MSTSVPDAWAIVSEASCASNNDISAPPLTESNTFVAPSIFASNNGDAIALRVASAARFSPDAEPIPIKAVP